MNRNPLRETLVQRGIKRKLFWSADTSNPDTISDELLIEQTLRYGDLPDLWHLFRLFDKATLRQVWEKRLAWIEQDYKNNRFRTYAESKIFNAVSVSPKRHFA
jgi:hypothetical protein